MEVVEPRALCRDSVDVRRFQNWMAVTAKPVSPLLVGDQKQEIRTFGHLQIIPFSQAVDDRRAPM